MGLLRHWEVAAFHMREARKYEAKADAAEAKGKTRKAARIRKVVERNRRLAVRHATASS